MKTIAETIEAAWHQAPPGREAVARNELLRQLWRYLRSEPARPAPFTGGGRRLSRRSSSRATAVLRKSA